MRNVFINESKETTEVVIEDDGIIVEYIINDKNLKSLEGNIYIGKVKNVLQGMQSFFIDIGQKKNGFLFFNDIGEKEDGIYEKKDMENDNIFKLLKNGQLMLVQIKKDAIDAKGAKLTTNISLTGRNFILTPKSHFVTISKKILDEKIKEKYISLVKEILPNQYGGIIRTNIIEATEQEIKEEIELLIKKWNVIEKYEQDILNYLDPQLIYSENDFLNSILRDILNQELDKIFVNNNKLYDEVCEKTRKISEKYLKKIQCIQTIDLLDMYKIRLKIEKATKQKVWLKCGGYLIINKTEALTAVDVNSGKYIGKKDLESTVFTVNKEAVIEIARQMRLRNMGGIIVVDFIDMQNDEHKQEIYELLKEEVKKDRSKIDVKGYTKLNLMEITRKRKNI